MESIVKRKERLSEVPFNASKEKIVRIDVVEVPNSTRDIKNPKGLTKKILPGVLKTLAPVLEKSGMIATGVTPEEYIKVVEHDVFASEEKYADFYRNIYVKVGAAGSELKLNIPTDFLIWKYLHFHPEVCTDVKYLNPAKHTFIMVDKEKEAEEKLSSMDYKIEAFSIIREMSEESVKDFLILYGRQSEGISYKEAKSLLTDYIEANPKKFITYYNDSSKEYKINFKKMLKNKILERRGGVLYYGEDVALGATPEQAVENLKNTENQELYIKLLDLLDD